MARTLAAFPEGSRITDYFSLGVITKTFSGGSPRSRERCRPRRAYDALAAILDAAALRETLPQSDGE